MTVVNVALPHMQGSLSASSEQITWVVTAYIVATAVITPVTGWLVARLGVKPMLLLCIGGFTVASALCGIAANLPELVIFRLLQGIVAAPLMPLAQAVLLNINPPERFGRAMALFTMGVVVAPVVGPVIGGYLTDSLSWRWCFYINVPAGAAALLLLWMFLPQEAPRPRRFDFLGFGALSIGVGALQLMLDRGPSLDWFSAREICVYAILAAVGFWVFVLHTATGEHPLFDRSLLRDRNFVASTIFSFFFSVLMFSSMVLQPLMMQGVLGYSVMYSGIVSVPRGVAMMIVLQIMGRLDAMVDRRLLASIGVGLIIAGFWQMAHFDLSMSSGRIVYATVLQGIGQGVLFVPLATLGFATIDPALRAEASSLSNLLRNLGGSVGISAVEALTAYNTQRMHASLATHIRTDDPVVSAGLPDFMSPSTAQGLVTLNAEITRQATMVAYVDDYRLLVGLGLFCVPLVLLLRQPARKAEAGIDAVVEAHP